jgi:hypothetical protein
VTRGGARHRSASSSPPPPPRRHCSRAMGWPGRCDPQRGRLKNSQTCWWHTRSGSVCGEAYACGWQRETAAVGGEIWSGLRRGGDQVMTRIDPVGRYISRSMRAGCGRLYRGWGAGGPIVYLVCAKKKHIQPANRLGRRDADRFAGSARVALRQPPAALPSPNGCSSLRY